MNPSLDQILFVSFCVEMYARRHDLSGADVLCDFAEHGVCEFPVESYDPLLSLGREEILEWILRVPAASIFPVNILLPLVT